jgi:heme-degrading monooxygenase HmoA
MSITLINLFDVPAEHDAEFQQRWQQVNDYMRRQPGYLGHTLHRAVAPDAKYRYVNVARWRSEDDFRTAHGPEFRTLISQPGWEKFPPQLALYEVVSQAEAERSPA